MGKRAKEWGSTAAPRWSAQDHRWDRAVEAVRHGLSRAKAAAVAGIDLGEFTAFVAAVPDYRRRLEQIEAEIELRLLEISWRHAENNWKACDRLHDRLRPAASAPSSAEEKAKALESAVAAKEADGRLIAAIKEVCHGDE